MKYQKIMLIFISCWVLSCSQDKITNEDESEIVSVTDVSKYDNSNLGVYKGVFTTLDANNRGEITIMFNENSLATAQLDLSDGQSIALKSKSLVASGSAVTDLEFASESSLNKVTFNFSVEKDGTNPGILNVKFNGKDSDILVGKDTSNRPIRPITGTYDCTNCSTIYPGFSNSPKTFNILRINGGNNRSFATQITYNGRVFNSSEANNIQNGCTPAVNGYRTCQISGSSQIYSYAMDYQGTHRYRQGGPASQACSRLEGTWSLFVANIGQLEGTFVSDSNCP